MSFADTNRKPARAPNGPGKVASGPIKSGGWTSGPSSDGNPPAGALIERGTQAFTAESASPKKRE